MAIGIKIYDKSAWQPIKDERELYRVHGWQFDREVQAARREAKQHREHTHGKRHPGGLGARAMTVPQHMVSAAMQVWEKEYRAGNTNDFWCWMWHRYPDFRCVTWKKCPWCKKTMDVLSFAV